MATGLPRRLDVPRLADMQAELEGSLPLADLPRLAALLADPAGTAEVWLRFARDPLGRAVVEGRVRSVLQLTCQRCLAAVAVPVDATLSLMAVSDADAAAAVPEDHEALLLEGRETASATLVEDELLLALPSVPRHATEAGCGTGPGAQPATVPQDERRNPFAALAALKERN